MPGLEDSVRSGDLAPLFDAIVANVPPPRVDAGPFKMLATLLDRDNFVGRVLTGRIASGKLTLNMPIRAIDGDGKVVEEGRATKIMAFRGLERVPVESAEAGEIVAIAGLTTATVANTIADPSVAAPIYAQPIDPPTLAMTFSVNDSPMAGREGSKVTSRMIRDRLEREAEGNVCVPHHRERRQGRVRGRRPRRAAARRADRDHAPRRLRAVDQPPARAVPRRRRTAAAARSPTRPSWSTSTTPTPRPSSSKIQLRKGELVEQRPSSGGKTRLVFSAPSRGLIGYHGEFLSDTRGTGIMNRLFERYGPYKGPSRGARPAC